MKIGLFFGSFNPLHIGHLAIANYAVEYGGISQVWFVVSPLNPFKNKSDLLPEYQRAELVNRAIDHDLRFRVNTIEFKLPQPSYTIDTIIYLKEQYPNHQFTILMGADQLSSFHKWKNPDQLKALCHFLIYPRPGFQSHPLLDEKGFNLLDAPQMEISASFIRQSIKEGKDVRYFLHPEVWKYMVEMNFYKG